MVLEAKELSLHANDKDPNGRDHHDAVASLPTASGGLARAAYAKAAAAGIDLDGLFGHSALTLAKIRNPRVRIPVRTQIAFLNRVALALRNDFLGVELAQEVDLRELGLLYYTLASSDTLGLALTRGSRFSTIFNEGVHIAYREGRGASLSFDYVGVARANDRHQIEFFATILLRLCRQLTDRKIVPSRLSFVHRRDRFPAKLRAMFGCQIEFGAQRDEIVFPIDTRSMLITRADPYLNSIMLESCEETLAKRRQKAGPWRSNIENVIAPLLPHGEATMAQAAERLGVSRRTLARRLARENVSFNVILNELRLNLAKEYLAEPGLQVGEVAWLLGFKEASTFSHAFKRWTGAPPTEQRRSGGRAAA
jgi:AraC-like DNA-binding protein